MDQKQKEQLENSVNKVLEEKLNETKDLIIKLKEEVNKLDNLETILDSKSYIFRLNLFDKSNENDNPIIETIKLAESELEKKQKHNMISEYDKNKYVENLHNFYKKFKMRFIVYKDLLEDKFYPIFIESYDFRMEFPGIINQISTFSIPGNLLVELYNNEFEDKINLSECKTFDDYAKLFYKLFSDDSDIKKFNFIVKHYFSMIDILITSERVMIEKEVSKMKRMSDLMGAGDILTTDPSGKNNSGPKLVTP